MAESENSTPLPSRLNQGVLLRSWAQMSVYDLTASQLKRIYLRRRYIVIGISLAATISAVP